MRFGQVALVINVSLQLLAILDVESIEELGIVDGVKGFYVDGDIANG